MFLIPTGACAQIIVDFENGELSRWTQFPQNRWEVTNNNSLRGNYSLHHNYDNPSSGHDQISYPLYGLSDQSDTITWQFVIKHSYNPSSANNWSVFLFSDRNAEDMYPGSIAEAVVAGVNFTGSDDLLKIWKMNTGDAEPFLATTLNWQDTIGTNAAEIKIQRSRDFNWKVWYRKVSADSIWHPAGESWEPFTPAMNYTGIYYEYSSAQDRKLWFDQLEINGRFIIDTLPPQVQSTFIPDPEHVIITFTEPVATFQGHSSGITLEPEPGFSTDHYFFLAPDSLQFTLNVDLTPEKTYQAIISGIVDLAGNRLLDSVITIIYTPGNLFDVVINEIMADPSPPIGLPDAEYIELFNRTDKDIRMMHWTIGIDESIREIPITLLPAGGFLIICNDKYQEELKPYGTAVGIDGMGTLRNSGAAISLHNGNGQLIHHIRYDLSWYGDSYSGDGGWSLEQIDPENPCPRQENWTVCPKFPGGTPGEENASAAINPDISEPAVMNLYLINDSAIFVRFNEMYDTLIAGIPGNYDVDQGVGHPRRVELNGPDYITLKLCFNQVFVPEKIYTLTFDAGIRDCSGNLLGAPLHFPVALPSQIDSFDVIVNEVLFNPPPDGSDYVELYNRSSRVIDLSTLYIGGKSEESQTPRDLVQISGETRLMFPETFSLLTEHPSWTSEYYPVSDQGVFIQPDHLPQLPDQSGGVTIIDSSGRVIDRFTYNEKMHFPLIEDPEGVSLERIRYDAPTEQPENWHSASTDSGFGTPGMPNSQHTDETSISKTLIIEPEIFSPDNDGYHDILSIHYHFRESGYSGKILIFNANGIMVKKLYGNIIFGRSGTLVWDGTDDSGRQLPTGIYLIYTEVFSLKGRVQKFKRTCVLARR